MPSTYAHYKFGKKVRKRLPQNIKNSIQKYDRLYMIGLHGPDIFFYYKPLCQNPVNTYGYHMHSRKGADVFSEMFNRSQELCGAEKEAVQAYIYGFLCHFALDRTCHPFVEEWINKSGIPHAEIEVEFDRALMIHYGLNPLKHKLTKHISTDIKEAEIIRYVFPQFSSSQIRKSLMQMKFFNNLFVAPGIIKRILVKGFIKLTGNSKEMSGLIVHYNMNEKCRDSTSTLIHLYYNAVDMAVEMITEMSAAFESGQIIPDEKYNHTFGAD